MNIESIIKRDPPTEVVLGDTTYKFLPDSQGRHVCDVTDKGHIARLLSIVEGYQLPDDDGKPKAVTPPAPVVPPAPVAQTIQPVDDNELKGSSVHPQQFEINGETFELVDIVAEAYELSGLTTADWNALEPEVRHNLIDAVLDSMSGGDGDDTNPKGDEDEPPAEVKVTTEAVAKAERDQLAAQWKARTGSLPHYKWTAEKIRAELAKD